jgi:fucose permease
MFTAYNSLQNIVSKMYDEYHFTNMGQTAVMAVYASFALATIFSSFIVKKLGYKKSMFFASLGYAIF